MTDQAEPEAIACVPVEISLEKLESAALALFTAMASSRAFDGMSELELLLVHEFALGVMHEATGAVLQVDDKLSDALPATVLGYANAERRGLSEKLRLLERARMYRYAASKTKQ